MGKREIYRNAVLLVGKNLDKVDYGYIVIEDGRIVEIGENPKFSEGIDLHDCLVIPGFVDAHTHIGDAFCKEAGVGLPTIDAVSPPNGRKYRLLRELTPEELKVSLSRAVDELRTGGIAAFGDFREGGVDGSAALREVLKDKPVHGVIFGEPVWKEGGVAGEHYLTDVEHLLDYSDGVGIGDIADFPQHTLKELGELVSKKRKRIAVHAAETREAQDRCVKIWEKTEIARTIEAGARLLVHVTHPFQEDLKIIGETNIPLVFCTRTNCILADGIPPLNQLFSLENPLALGTDNVMFTSPDMFREMDFVSRLLRVTGKDANAVTSRKVLRAATFGGAEVLGLENDFGSLEEGKRASFTAVDLTSVNLRGVRDVYSALVHRASINDIFTVVSHG